MILSMVLLGAPIADPTFDLVKTLVGGRWEGNAAPGVKVQFRYALEPDGNAVAGTGSIDDGKKVVPVHVAMGWDPTSKQVYYLDRHGSDVVYFGHITRKRGALVFDFNGLSGDKGHYKMEMTLEKAATSTTMSGEADGKWTDYGVHVVMKRKG